MTNILKTFQKHNWLKFLFYTASIFLFAYASNFFFKNIWNAEEFPDGAIIYSIYDIPVFIGVLLLSLVTTFLMKRGKFLKNNEQWRILKKPFVLTIIGSALFVLIFNHIPILIFDPESGFTFTLYFFSSVYVAIVAQYLVYIIQSWGIIVFVPFVISIIALFMRMFSYEIEIDPRWILIPFLIILWLYSYQAFKYFRERDILRQLYVLTLSGFMATSYMLLSFGKEVWIVTALVVVPYCFFVAYEHIKTLSWKRMIHFYSLSRLGQITSLMVIAILTVLIAYLPIFHSSVTFHYENPLPRFGYVIALFMFLPFALLGLIQLFTKDINSQKLECLVSLKAFGSYLIIAFVVITTLLNMWETKTLTEVRGIVADEIERYYIENEEYPRTLQDIYFEDVARHQRQVIRQQFNYGNNPAFTGSDPYNLYYLRKFPSFYEKVGYSPLYKEWEELPF